MRGQVIGKLSRKNLSVYQNTLPVHSMRVSMNSGSNRKIIALILISAGVLALIAGHLVGDIFYSTSSRRICYRIRISQESRIWLEVRLYGRVGDRGVYSCPCFRLTSGGESLRVWYDSIEGGFPAVGLINNGDRVIVTGTFTRLVPSEESTSPYPSETGPLDPYAGVQEKPGVQEHFSIQRIEKLYRYYLDIPVLYVSHLS